MIAIKQWTAFLRFITFFGMAKPIRLPNATEQAVLDGLTVRLIESPEQARWDELICRKHYLKNARLVGEQLRYVAEYQGQWMALLGWSAPALHLQARDRWLGWSPEQRRQRRHFLAQNSRFLILGDPHQFPNLATRSLARCCARLSEDWLEHHDHPIVAVESFVDGQITRGTAYKASGWTLLGPTAGFGRCAKDFYERHDRPKQLWVRVLDSAGTAGLKADPLPPTLEPCVQPAPPRCDVSARLLPSLLERLPLIPDPRGRKGRWHPWPAVLGIIALAKLAGVAGGQRDLAAFAERLNQYQRRHLRCRRDPKTDRYAVPGQTTFFRALAAVDYLSFERVVLDWQNDLLGPQDPNEMVVLDGKSINAAGQMTVCAVSVPSGRVHGLEPVRPKDPDLAPEEVPPAGAPVPPEPLATSDPARPAPKQAGPAAPKATPKKENEIPAARRLLARANLVGRLVSLDAMHTQHQTAAQIVLGSGADYLFTLRDNQPTLVKTAQTLMPGVFFPSGRGDPGSAHGPHRGDQSRSSGDPQSGHPPD